MLSSVTSVNFKFMNSKAKLQTEHQLDHYSKIEKVKDGAFYCAYVLRISRYSGFLWVVPTKTGIFLRGLLNYVERAELSIIVLSVSKQKIGVTMHFSEIIKFQY